MIPKIKDQNPYVLCQDCGYGVRKKTMFIKGYRHSAIILCRKCAKKLAEEINEKYTEEGK